MPYVVTESCIKCKYMDCCEVCPVDCFYEGANMLVINRDECIDCGVCAPECTAEAILPDSYNQASKWEKLNEEFSEKSPNIVKKVSPPADGDKFKDEEDKFKKYFSDKPGSGSLE